MTAHRGGFNVSFRPGRDWNVLERLLDKQGQFVRQNDLIEAIGAYAKPDDLHKVICRVRQELRRLGGATIQTRRDHGYRLRSTSLAAIPADRGAERYRGSYRATIHLLRSEYVHNRPQMLDAVERAAARLRPWVAPFANCTAGLLAVDDFRLAYKRAFDTCWDDPDGEFGCRFAFSAVPDLLRLHCVCADERAMHEVVDIARSEWKTADLSGVEGGMGLELTLERPCELTLGDASAEPHAVRTARVEVVTCAAYTDQLRRRSAAHRAHTWTPDEPITAASLRAYACAALGAAAFDPGADLHDPRPALANAATPIWSPLWGDQSLTSAGFANWSSLRDIDERVRRGFPSACHYRTTPVGRETFARGDVTDLLSKSLMFGSDAFFATYPALDRTAEFKHRQVSSGD